MRSAYHEFINDNNLLSNNVSILSVRKILIQEVNFFKLREPYQSIFLRCASKTERSVANM